MELVISIKIKPEDGNYFKIQKRIFCNDNNCSLRIIKNNKRTSLVSVVRLGDTLCPPEATSLNTFVLQL